MFHSATRLPLTPAPGQSTGQRAYNDALHDLLAPAFTGYPVIRLVVPDRDLVGVVDKLEAVLEGVSTCPRSTVR